jgi:hypothetical protein
MGESEQNPRWRFGFLGIIVLVCIIGFFVWAATPNFINRNRTSLKYICINNLRQIDAAAREFAFEHNKTNGDVINFPNDLTPYMKLNEYGKIPSCPSGGTYSIKKVGDKPTCSLGTNVIPWHVLP